MVNFTCKVNILRQTSTLRATARSNGLLSPDGQTLRHDYVMVADGQGLIVTLSKGEAEELATQLSAACRDIDDWERERQDPLDHTYETSHQLADSFEL